VRSAVFEARDLEQRRNYTFLRHEEKRNLDASGKTSKVTRRTSEVLILYGRPYERTVAENGKPLPPEKEKKEQEKFDKEMRKRREESAKSREKHIADEKKDIEEARQFRLEVADAYNFSLLGDDLVDGHPAWIIQAEPRTDFRPRSREGGILPKIRGKLWVSKEDHRWVRIEAEVVQTFSFGWMLLRLNPGSRLTFEAMKINDEVWMPRQAYIRGEGRLALLKKINLELLVRWEKYRKFQSDSRIVAVSEPE